MKLRGFPGCGLCREQMKVLVRTIYFRAGGRVKFEFQHYE